jgi:hypothetical protein
VAPEIVTVLVFSGDIASLLCDNMGVQVHPHAGVCCSLDIIHVHHLNMHDMIVEGMEAVRQSPLASCRHFTFELPQAEWEHVGTEGCTSCQYN